MSWCFFFNDTAATEIYTLSLHDALPIYPDAGTSRNVGRTPACRAPPNDRRVRPLPGRWLLYTESSRCCDSRAEIRDAPERSEEHTSELQSRQYLVCRLLLEKKKNKTTCT